MRRKKGTAFVKDEISGDSDGEDTTDSGFVLDPEQIFDELPQPFRLIDKTLIYIFDEAWETIKKLELRREELGLGGRIPLFDCAKKLSDFFQPTFLGASTDGKYTFLVANNGVIYALDANTSSVVATNEELQGLNILSLATCSVDESRHFLCTVMDNGSAAIFALSNGNIHLLRVFNEDSSIKNSIATDNQVSFDGNYIAVSWQIPLKSSWLDIYKVPKEFWINEIDLADKKAKKSPDQETSTKDEEATKAANTSLENDSSDSDAESVHSRTSLPVQSGTHTGYLGETSFTKPSLILKVKSPVDVVPNTAGNAAAALKVVDPENNVLPTGTNHVLLPEYFENSYAMFKHSHGQYLQYLSESNATEDSYRRTPTVHFLTPGKFFPTGLENASDKANSIIIHWSNDCNGFLYSLVKTTKDVERKPDIVLANSSTILVSAVSVCRTAISFGLKNKNIVTWDKLRGSPLHVVSLSTGSAITSLHFLPTIKTRCEVGARLSSTSRLVKLLACCEDGGLRMVQYDEDGHANVGNVPISSFKPKDEIVQVTHFNNLPKLVLVQRRSGMIVITDTCSETVKCHIGLIKPLTMLQGFCYAHETSTLFIRGGQKDEYEEEILPESVSVFTMNIQSFPVLKKYYDEEVQTEIGQPGTKLEKRIEEMEKERIRTLQQRHRHRAARWRQFEAEIGRKKTTVPGGSPWFSGPVKYGRNVGLFESDPIDTSHIYLQSRLAMKDNNQCQPRCQVIVSCAMKGIQKVSIEVTSPGMSLFHVM